MQRVVDGEGVDVWWDAPGQLDVGQSTSASGGHCAVSWRGGHRALQRTELMAVLTVLRGAVPAACGDGNGHFWSGARMDEKATRMEEGEHGQSCGGRCPRSRGKFDGGGRAEVSACQGPHHAEAEEDATGEDSSGGGGGHVGEDWIGNCGKEGRQEGREGEGGDSVCGLLLQPGRVGWSRGSCSTKGFLLKGSTSAESVSEEVGK